MPTNLLVLPLLGGFIFIHFCWYFKFWAQRLESYRLLMVSAVVGAVLFFCARVVILFLESTSIAWLHSLGQRCKIFLSIVAPFDYSGVAVGACLLSAVAAFLINRCGGGKTKIIRRVTKRSGTGFQKLLNEAEWHKRTIGITLANNKWYAGYVAQNPNLSPHEEYFALLPILSGYRARDTLKVTPTIYYNLLQAKGVDTTEYIVTLPIADVKIASFFDAKQYETHFATEDPSGVNPPQDLPIEIRVSARDAVITENIFS